VEMSVGNDGDLWLTPLMGGGRGVLTGIQEGESRWGSKGL
jgi:hypothetical protein